MNTRCIYLANVSLVLAAMAGCGKDGPTTIPIRGEVIYNGAPLKEGTVVYLPKQPGQGRQATGAIQQDGSFVLTTFKDGDGVVPGAYDIVIYAYKPHPGEPRTREEMEAVAAAGRIERGFIIPENYTNSATSGLSDIVNGEHSGFKRIELSDG